MGFFCWLLCFSFRFLRRELVVASRSSYLICKRFLLVVLLSLELLHQFGAQFVAQPHRLIDTVGCWVNRSLLQHIQDLNSKIVLWDSLLASSVVLFRSVCRLLIVLGEKCERESIRRPFFAPLRASETLKDRSRTIPCSLFQSQVIGQLCVVVFDYGVGEENQQVTSFELSYWLVIQVTGPVFEAGC